VYNVGSNGHCKANSSMKMALQLQTHGLLAYYVSLCSGNHVVLVFPLQSTEDDCQCREHIVLTSMTDHCCDRLGA